MKCTNIVCDLTATLVENEFNHILKKLHLTILRSTRSLLLIYFLAKVQKYKMAPDKSVIKTKAVIAPKKTVNRECLIAMIAAMNHVLSPNSDTIMTDIEANNA